MKPVFLTGEVVYLRPMVPEDKDVAVAWYDSPVPVNSVLGEKTLTELHTAMWNPSTRQYAIVRQEDDRVIGGAAIDFAHGDRKATISLHMAPLLERADELQAEALRILLPWLIEEHNMRRVDLNVGANDAATIAAAEELGMFAGVRLREYWQRPGGRVDMLIYQILNPHEVHPHA